MTVRKRSKKWFIDFYFEHPDGQKERIRKLSPVNTKRGAERYEQELRKLMLEGISGKRKEIESPFLEEFAPEFIENYAEVYNRPSTVIGKKKNLRVNLIPEFGRLRLNEITQYRIDRYKKKKLDQGLSPKTINNHLTILRKLLSVAEEWGKLESIPKIKWLKPRVQKFDFLNFNEADNLIQAAQGKWKTMILVALKTGLRQGELLELRWSDINFITRNMFVSRSIHRGHIGPTKSGQCREIPLCDDVLNELENHKHSKNELVFCDSDGNHLTDGKCRRPLWKACKAAGLNRRVLWHVLRHTFASHLAMSGVTMKAIQELLGHSDIRTTMRYAHLDPKVKREAVQMLNSLGTIWAPNHPTLKIVSNIN